MYNFGNRKNKKVLTAIVIVVLVLSMVVPMLLSAVGSFM